MNGDEHFRGYSLAVVQFGLASTLCGVSQCDEEDQMKVSQYYMVRWFIELFWLSVIAAPYGLATGGEQGLAGLYALTAWYIVALTHSLRCCYIADTERMVFWGAGLTTLFLGALGIFHENSTAADFYNFPELMGAPDVIFKLVGLGCVLLVFIFYSCAEQWRCDDFEKIFVYVYGFVCVYNFYNDVILGIFTDLANIFLLYCWWKNYALQLLTESKRFLPAFLFWSAKKASEATSPKSGPSKKRGRSQTPGRKSR